MKNYEEIASDYLDRCANQKRLNPKTLRAYSTDLKQLGAYIAPAELSEITPHLLENYISSLHDRYRPRTVKRKIASMKAFFRYLEYHEIIPSNPWARVQFKFREPSTLPRIIPLENIQRILTIVYRQISDGKTELVCTIAYQPNTKV